MTGSRLHRSATLEILRLAQPSGRQFAPGLISAILSAAAGVGLLATSSWLITRAADMPPIMYLNVAIVGVRFFAFSRAGFRYADRLSSHDAAFRSLSRLRVAIFRRLIPLAPDGLSGTRRGDLLSRLVSDIDQLQDLPLRVVAPTLTALVVAGASVTTAWLILPAAGITLLITLILAAIVGTVLQAKLSARADAEIAPRRADLDDAVMDTLGRLDVLTAFAALDSRMEGIKVADERLRSSQLRRSLSLGLVAAIVSLLAGATTVLVLFFGIPQLVFVPNASETPGLGWGVFSGPYLAIVALMPIAVFEVFSSLPQALSAWRVVRTSAERVAEAVPAEIPAEIPADLTSGALSLAGPFSRLDLLNVGASWPNATAASLGPVSFSLEPGDRLLIAGPSGSGKTTLAHVMVRFLEFTGTFEINGTDVHRVAPDDVRRVIGLLEQTPHLFDDTIRQNLVFASPDATDEDLMKVLARVGLAGWAAERGGLDSPVGERGALLSGGQAQRLGLARALLHDFPVLILDEPTANVDPGFADDLIRDILTAASNSRRAIVLISHIPVDDALVTKKLLFP
jgi:ATP-binding cassette subfamily C protein CydC